MRTVKRRSLTNQSSSEQVGIYLSSFVAIVSNFLYFAGLDPIDKCPNCYSRLETGAKTVNFSINLSDMSVLVDCMQCGVRVRMKGALGDKQKEFLSCGW